MLYKWCKDSICNLQARKIEFIHSDLVYLINQNVPHFCTDDKSIYKSSSVRFEEVEVINQCSLKKNSKGYPKNLKNAQIKNIYNLTWNSHEKRIKKQIIHVDKWEKELRNLVQIIQMRIWNLMKLTKHSHFKKNSNHLQKICKIL